MNRRKLPDLEKIIKVEVQKPSINLHDIKHAVSTTRPTFYLAALTLLFVTLWEWDGRVDRNRIEQKLDAVIEALDVEELGNE